MKIMLIQPSEFSSSKISLSYKKWGRLKSIHDRHGHKGIINLPPIGLMYIATPLIKAGHEVMILDAASLQLTNGEIARETAMFKPDLIGISLYSFFIRVVHKLTRDLKATVNAPIVLGGPHATVMADKVFEEFQNIDYVFRGWGEFSINDFIEFIQGRKKPEDVAGLCFKVDGKVIKNVQADIPKDDNLIPSPSREPLKELYDNKMYFNIMSSRKNMDILVTSRNCPYRCNFCFQLGNYREHPPERVLAEIREMRKRGIDSIEIMDDSVTINRKRFETILDLIIAENFGIEFRIRSRSNALDERLLRKLKLAGCRAISYGMESGSEPVLKFMNKRTTVAQNEAACSYTKKMGILCQSSWVAGFPGETEEMWEETLNFVRKTLPHTFTFYECIPYPGTVIYEEAKKNDTLVGDWSIDCDDIYIKHQEKPTIKAFRDKIIKEQREILLSSRFIFQTLAFLLRYPNRRLFMYGTNVAVGKIKNISALKRRDGGNRIF